MCYTDYYKVIWYKKADGYTVLDLSNPTKRKRSNGK